MEKLEAIRYDSYTSALAMTAWLEESHNSMATLAAVPILSQSHSRSTRYPMLVNSCSIWVEIAVSAPPMIKMVAAPSDLYPDSSLRTMASKNSGLVVTIGIPSLCAYAWATT